MRAQPADDASELSARVSVIFEQSGPLARHLPAFEPREGQRAMAAAVAECLMDGGVLLAEAGTGIGKTLAYLVPAILSGRRVLVSTGTKNLQEQIFTKDLPLLARVLPRFTATCMKGRGNYLCLHRFEQLRQTRGVTSDRDRLHLTLIEEWAATTRTGDRAEIDELPDDVSFWRQIAATTENCLGSTCPRFADCFVTRMRQRAAESDVVVVNHHLLCADAALRHHSFGEVIPDCPSLVIDEAHQLEDVATQYFGLAVSTYRLSELVSDGDRILRRGDIRDAQQAADVRQRLAHVEMAARSFFAALSRVGRSWTAVMRESETEMPGGEQAERMDPEDGTSRGRMAPRGLFDERIRVTPTLLDVAGEAGLVLGQSLDALGSALALASDATEDVKAVGRRTEEIREELRFLLRADDPAFVYFLEIRGPGLFLRASPIDVSSIVRERLLDRMRTSVLTSATLAVGGSFDYIRRRLGIRHAHELQLPSEFDHAAQSILYLPRRMPDPRQENFLPRAADEIVEILLRTEGRALVLFTSHAALRAVHARTVSRLPYPILVQGTAPSGVLLDRFRRGNNAVLLATSSFWQGVDVIGDALSCVIIDKLPFASPGDPIVSARIEAIVAQGGDAFGQYQVPLAILTLLQGLGRLLRHRADRGVLAILDPRLQTMGYGRRFLASLPPSPITRTLDDISRFLASPAS